MAGLERIEAEMAKQLSLIFSKVEIRDPRVKGIITVCRVSVDTELTYAKVYISIFGADGEEENVLKGLNSAEGFIKSKLKSQIRLRKLPELHFIIDDSNEYSKKIEELLEGIKNK